MLPFFAFLMPAPARAPLTTEKVVLRQAAQLLRDGHLVKDVLYDNLGGYCIQGAIFKAATGRSHGFPHDPWRDDKPEPETMNVIALALRRAEKAAGLKPNKANNKRVPTASNVLARWNNAEERTVEEVIAVLEKAAA